MQKQLTFFFQQNNINVFTIIQDINFNVTLANHFIKLAKRVIMKGCCQLEGQTTDVLRLLNMLNSQNSQISLIADTD